MKGRPWALENLPPFPGVALQLLQLLSEEDVNIRRVSMLIAADPVIAADVLQIANSALFGLRSPVKTIAHAVIVLGVDNVKSVTLTRAFGIYLMPAMKEDAMRRCWRNSLAGALLAGKLAYQCEIDGGLAYTAGLLRDIGRLALLVKFPGPYANLLAVSQDNGFDILEAERDLFDIDHCQAGEWLTENMGLPVELCQVAALHHQGLEGDKLGLVQLVQVADMMAEGLGFGVLMSPEPPDFAALVAGFPERVRSWLKVDEAALKAEIEASLRVLSPEH